MIAAELEALDVASKFVCMTSGAREMLARQSGHYHVATPHTYIQYGEENDPGLASHHAERNDHSVASLFLPRNTKLNFGQSVGLDQLLDALGFDLREAVRQLAFPHIGYSVNLLNKAAQVLEQETPCGIIYDIHGFPPVLSFLLEARNRRIPTFSLQHASGDSVQYSSLPVVADYYFAYSRHNQEVLRSMGIDESAIFLTGAPGDAFVHSQGDFITLRDKFRAARKVGDEQKLMSLALKPCYEPEFQSMRKANFELIDTVGKLATECSDWLVYLRRHPRDKMWRDTDLERLANSFKGKVHFDSNDSPIEELLLASDYFVTFQSACIPQAIECQVQTCVVAQNDGAVWPNWQKHGAYKTIELSNAEKFFRDIMSRHNACPKISKEHRDNFLSEFSTHPSPANAKRIAAIIALRAC
ncbi:MAG: hypothetical protein HQL45_12915 [Alphaproteobacteria bacterium]|nr:hypothetical protein [Alphaproteobacteria bacterium]